MLCQTLFWIDSDPKTTPKSIKNRSKIYAQVKVGKGLISAALRFNFEENLMLMPKEPIFKNHATP